MGDNQPRFIQDDAKLWQAADKVVCSRTVRTVSSARTRIERDFDPHAVRRWKATATRDVSVGGPGLAASAMRAGLVDEYHLFVVPVLVGGGTPALPGQVRMRLELVDEHRFGSGVVHLHYAVVE